MIYGTKGREKIYRKHSGQPGNLQERNIRQIMAKDWKRVVRQAVDGMLPKNNLRPQFLERLHIFPEVYHDFEFLPQFVPRTPQDPNELLQHKHILDDPETKIIFAASLENMPENFKKMKYEPQDLEVPFHMRKDALGGYNKKELKAYKRHMRLLRRFTVFNHQTLRYEIR